MRLLRRSSKPPLGIMLRITLPVSGIHQRPRKSATPPLSTGLEKPCRIRTQGSLNEHLERHETATDPVRLYRYVEPNGELRDYRRRVLKA